MTPSGAGNGEIPAVAAPVEYRHDLDGLRAVAILLVAVYHVWVHRVSGGVDIFLLLSGYFVGGALVRGFAVGRPVELRTYVPRLARRLLPVLLVVLGVVVCASWIVLPRTRWADMSWETLASLGYWENWRLAASGQAYGAPDVLQSPLQHVWSLSVQGQLFGALPLVLLGVAALARGLAPESRTRLLRWAVAFLAVASFTYATVMVQLDQGFAYYDTAARAWEYLAGVLLSFGAGVRLARRWSALLGWLGLAIVLAAGVLVDGQAQFPGPQALVPLAGAALLVLSGGDGGSKGPGRILAWRPLSRAGRYAYAYYLWHWPVLVLTIAVRDRPVGWLAGTGVLVLSGLLAWATYHLVEASLRRAPAPRARVRWTWGSRVAFAVVVALGVGTVAAPAVWLQHVQALRGSASVAGDPAMLAKYPGALAVVDPKDYTYDASLPPIPDPVAASEDKVRAVFEACGTPAGDANVTVCSWGDLDAERVVTVVGGSHAEQWIDALAAIGEEEGFRVDSVIKWACALFDGTEGVEELLVDPTCRQWNRDVFRLLERRVPDVVFTTATRPATDGETSKEKVPGAYVAAWERLARSGIRTVAVRDTPWTGTDPVACVAEVGSGSPSCQVARSAVLDEVSPLELFEPPAGTVFLDLDDVLCPDDSCPFVQGGRIVYRDQHHLTATYATSVAPVLRDRLGPALGWW
ncbi:acyltransferase [Antribacter sp. KLBMP9083]|uniref:Acyltransferase n=1 Tax=Antribacter soli TaxID=2910976 RepID=A0AA41UAG2_9MICO|nr:acyltransferase family protein [Antribacter soli]MCF4120104.1 acyltransferase [Antribacter soli]